MTDSVRVDWTDNTATITLDHPPVNALGASLRADLMRAVEAALEAREVRVIILAASGRAWSVGADIGELGTNAPGPTLSEICARIAASPKPVIAALHGSVLGGGLELALCAGLRLAAPGTKLGLPEVTLGLLPGAGGTQRLPRLIGARAAIGLMLSGLPVAAERALKLGLVDVVTGEPVAAGRQLVAAWLTEEADLPIAASRPARGHDADAWLSAVADARKGLGEGRRLPAPGRIIDCVEAALLLPEDEGFAMERAAFEDLLATPESASLRHAFLAERRAPRHEDLSGVVPREIAHVGVIGGGALAAAVATAALGTGASVTLVCEDATVLSEGLARVATLHERAVQAGRLSAEAREAEWDRIAGATGLDALGSADLVVEATGHRVTTTLSQADKVAPPGAILATATSFAALDRIAAAAGRTGHVIGLSFAPPVHASRLVEIVEGSESSAKALATAFAFVRRAGKTGIRARASDGLIGERIWAAYMTAMDLLLEDGATPYEIDRAMAGYGFPVGPYRSEDTRGLDIGWARRKRMAPARDPEARYPVIADRLCEAGWLGRKAGRGYYAYPEGKEGGTEDDDVLRLIEAVRVDKGIVARPVGEREIVERARHAMANEGVRILEQGIATRPSDIDVVMLAGYGFPRWRGGPMMEADREGPLLVRDALRDHARTDPAFWKPAAMWDELIKNGRKFADLNEG